MLSKPEFVLCVVKFNFVVESLVGKIKGKKKKTICFVLEREIQSDFLSLHHGQK
jgi:hypothetical protein